MKLVFVHMPVTSLETVLPFYRETLGWDEAWREGKSTVAFQIPDSDAQVMLVADTVNPAGPMYLVPSVSTFLTEHPEIPIAAPEEKIPDGSVVGLSDPSGNVFFVFDQVTT